MSTPAENIAKELERLGCELLSPGHYEDAAGNHYLPVETAKLPSEHCVMVLLRQAAEANSTAGKHSTP